MTIIQFLYEHILLSSLINGVAFSVFYVVFCYIVDNFLERRSGVSEDSKKFDFYQTLRTFWTITPCIALYLYLVENYSMSYTDISTYGVTWWICSIPIYYLINDAVFYWIHRVLHTEVMYKLSHQYHHKSKPPSVYTALSADVIEFLSEGIFSGFFQAFIIPIHYTTHRILALSIMIWSCFVHAETDFLPRCLEPYIVTSKYHHVHHKYGRNNQSNFSMVFTLWDRLCGTVRFPRPTDPENFDDLPVDAVVATTPF